MLETADKAPETLVLSPEGIASLEKLIWTLDEPGDRFLKIKVVTAAQSINLFRRNFAPHHPLSQALTTLEIALRGTSLPELTRAKEAVIMAIQSIPLNTNFSEAGQAKTDELLQQLEDGITDLYDACEADAQSEVPNHIVADAWDLYVVRMDQTAHLKRSDEHLAAFALTLQELGKRLTGNETVHLSDPIADLAGALLSIKPVDQKQINQHFNQLISAIKTAEKQCNDPVRKTDLKYLRISVGYVAGGFMELSVENPPEAQSIMQRMADKVMSMLERAKQDLSRAPEDIANPLSPEFQQWLADSELGTLKAIMDQTAEDSAQPENLLNQIDLCTGGNLYVATKNIIETKPPKPNTSNHRFLVSAKL